MLLCKAGTHSSRSVADPFDERYFSGLEAAVRFHSLGSTAFEGLTLRGTYVDVREISGS